MRPTRAESNHRRTCSTKREVRPRRRASNTSEQTLINLNLPDNAYDLVFSSLAFHYLVNLPGLSKEIHKSLTPGGKLVFSIEHPIFTGPTCGGLISDADGRKIWPLDAYQKEELRLRNWFVDGVRKTASYSWKIYQHLAEMRL
ncbi:putative Methylase [Seiridium cardinale]|uniref:Methylase n=1 Tax=Seiridium cardinale TaxID=138064 RepID=A0ABR2Y4B7_9PEZI